MACYILIKKFSPFLFRYFNQVNRRKDLKCRYFALISLKTDLPFNFYIKIYA